MTNLLTFQSKCNGVLVQVPDISYEHHVFGEKIQGLCWWDSNMNSYDAVTLPPGSWQIEGEVTHISEEVMERVCGYKTFEGEDEKYWYLYVEPGKVKANIFCDTATESFASLLTSLNATEGRWILLVDKKL